MGMQYSIYWKCIKGAGKLKVIILMMLYWKIKRWLNKYLSVGMEIRRRQALRDVNLLRGIEILD